jgi:hypothetical protein
MPNNQQEKFIGRLAASNESGNAFEMSFHLRLRRDGGKDLFRCVYNYCVPIATRIPTL